MAREAKAAGRGRLGLMHLDFNHDGNADQDDTAALVTPSAAAGARRGRVAADRW